MHRTILSLLWLLSLLICGLVCWHLGSASPGEPARSVLPRSAPAAAATRAPDVPRARAGGMAAVVAKVGTAADMDPASGEFADAIRGVMREPDGRRRMAAWYALLENLTPSHLAAIVPLIRENDIRGPGSGSEWAMLWEVWAAKDGAGAMAFLQDHDWTGWSKLSRPGARYNAMIGWGRGDPEAAAAWLLQPGNHQEDLQRALIEGWSNKDPEGAATWVVANKAAVKSMDPILGEICRRGGVDRLEQWFREQKLPSVYMEKAAGAVASARIRTDPQAAAAWLVEHQREPWWGDGDTLVNKVNELARAAPELALQTAQALDSPQAAGYAIDAWCQTDIRAASEWMKANPNMKHYDAAVSALAARLKNDDPEAARAWAETVRDPARRADLLQHLRDDSDRPR